MGSCFSYSSVLLLLNTHLKCTCLLTYFGEWLIVEHLISQSCPVERSGLGVEEVHCPIDLFNVFTIEVLFAPSINSVNPIIPSGALVELELDDVFFYFSFHLMGECQMIQLLS